MLQEIQFKDGNARTEGFPPNEEFLEGGVETKLNQCSTLC